MISGLRFRCEFLDFHTVPRWRLAPSGRTAGRPSVRTRPGHENAVRGSGSHSGRYRIDTIGREQDSKLRPSRMRQETVGQRPHAADKSHAGKPPSPIRLPIPPGPWRRLTFQSLRGLIDHGRRKDRQAGRLLLPGSASSDLGAQSDESLARRIASLERAAWDALETPPDARDTNPRNVRLFASKAKGLRPLDPSGCSELVGDQGATPLGLAG